MTTQAASIERPNALADRGQLKAFLLHEAHLLDERRFAEWIDLFTEDGYYWAPSRRTQESPFNEVSLFYDDRAAMLTRLRRFNHPSLHSQTPIPLSTRVVSNFVIEEMNEPSQVCTVRSKFIMFEYHPGVPEGEERVFGGTYTHQVAWRDGRFWLLWKKAVLANADARFGALFVYF
jgi:3-phenylpropionate/cinnamic acid dioxygenase small subunit